MSRTRTPRRAALALALLLVVAACSGGSSSKAKSDDKSDKSDTKATDHTDEVQDIAAFKDNDPVVGKDKFGPDDDDKIIEAAIADIEDFWTQEFPLVYGSDYVRIDGGHYPYGPPPNDPPLACPTTDKGNYDDVGPNAFYCFSPGDYVEWDTDEVTNQLLEDFGPFALGIVMAHEIGHGISDRAGVIAQKLGTFVQEQQADCFAGSYTQWVAQGSSGLYELRLKDLDSALGAFLQIRDPVGNDAPNDPNGHGSAFQRINAFEDGLQGGADVCKGYADGNFTFVPETFVDETDYANQGNLAPDEVEPDVVQSLENFWTASIGESWTALNIAPFDPDTDTVTCGENSGTGDEVVGVSLYCPADDTALWDEHYLMPAANEIGDLAQATLIADIYSNRAQYIAGLPTDTLDADLQRACFTGVWVGSLATAELTDELTLSPGDLDEAVAAFLKFSADADEIEANDSPYGSAFERLDAFRAGFQATYTGNISNGFELCINNGGADAATDDVGASDASDVFTESDFSS